MVNNIYIKKYLNLLSEFVNNDIEASEFERKFLEIHRTDPSDYSPEIHKIISILFSDVDNYCSDSQIRDEGDLDDHELWGRAKVALRKLRKAISG
ncbi:hypothetical protein GCM10027036_25120 [Flavihumibacter cheonanensis]|uniref:colicin immunity domain-containing protein n=1 Tax=Flavihumibacter cheonanensis TaxID=1442385 RepID=UPI001EF90CEF|nr:colicin immunity domain-containing protein [Flavihumibacter cheonanensis]MCG7754835.1 colicin immunity domain-containing protein [Flavihumibacter cheonanensis]